MYIIISIYTYIYMYIIYLQTCDRKGMSMEHCRSISLAASAAALNATAATSWLGFASQIDGPFNYCMTYCTIHINF